MTPYYADDAVTLYHGDCLEVMGQLPDEVADCTLTDAPYNAGFLYGDGTNDARPWPEYAAWMDARIAHMERLSRGPVMVFVSVPGMTELARLRRPKWVGAWMRTTSGDPAGDNRGLLVLPTWEPYLLYGDMAAFKFATPDAWHARPNYDHNGHPCPKPLPLMEAMIRRIPCASVLDPFAGAGTTLLAAKNEGRRAIGVEIDERYCEIAARRLAQDTLFAGAAS